MKQQTPFWNYFDSPLWLIVSITTIKGNVSFYSFLFSQDIDLHWMKYRNYDHS